MRNDKVEMSVEIPDAITVSTSGILSKELQSERRADERTQLCYTNFSTSGEKKPKKGKVCEFPRKARQ